VDREKGLPTCSHHLPLLVLTIRRVAGVQVSDFRAFREMMLHAKTTKEEASSAPAPDDGALNFGTKPVLEVEGIMEMCAAMSASSESAEGWTQVLKNDWLIIERKPVEAEVRQHKDEAYMRGVMTMNVSYVECVDMMNYFGERRRLWDSNFRGIELPFGGSFILDDDCRMISKIDFGALMHMAGIPRTLNTKLYRRWDHPEKGQVQHAMSESPP